MMRDMRQETRLQETKIKYSFFGLLNPVHALHGGVSYFAFVCLSVCVCPFVCVCVSVTKISKKILN